jgi:hypothetical protein
MKQEIIRQVTLVREPGVSVNNNGPSDNLTINNNNAPSNSNDGTISELASSDSSSDEEPSVLLRLSGEHADEERAVELGDLPAAEQEHDNEDQGETPEIGVVLLNFRQYIQTQTQQHRDLCKARRVVDRETELPPKRKRTSKRLSDSDS